MAILVRKWEHSRLESRKAPMFTVKIIDKGKVFRQYTCISEACYNDLLLDYKNHAIIDFVNVAAKKDLLS